MKLSEVIQQVKTEKPHSFSSDHCTIFINEIEAQVQEYLGIPAEQRKKYDWAADGNTELIVPQPYSNIYISYLKARIDYCNEEYESYANNQAMHSDDMEEFRAWAIREDMVLNKPKAEIMNWW